MRLDEEFQNQKWWRENKQRVNCCIFVCDSFDLYLREIGSVGSITANTKVTFLKLLLWPWPNKNYG